MNSENLLDCYAVLYCLYYTYVGRKIFEEYFRIFSNFFLNRSHIRYNCESQ